MTTLLFSVLAATSLAAAGVAAPVETRSAQSLPNNQLAMPAGNADATGKLHTANRLADGTPNSGWDHTDRRLCDFHQWSWDSKLGRCHRNVLPVYIIGAGVTAGFIYALSSRDGSPSNQSALSH